MSGPARPPPNASRPPVASPDRVSGAISPAGQAAASAVQALARAARTVVLYDAGNAAVRQLISEYQTRLRAALASGELSLEVQPFDLLAAGEVVYHEADREKSLAYKLYRDGVRRLAFRPEVAWEELVQLLEILAVRYTGVRQQEEDIVTLLRKAEFQGIALRAVEGWTPAEENPEPAVDAAVERARRVQPPAGWDTPLPRLPQPGPLAWRALPDEALSALCDDARAEEGMAELALPLARDLLAEALRAGWPSPNSDLTAFFAELRDALLADGKLASLKGLVDLLAQSGGGELRDEMLRGLGDARTLQMVLELVPGDATALPGELVAFLPLLGMGPALDLLATPELPEARRRLLAALVLARVPRETDPILARLPGLPVEVARELARGVVARAPERAPEVARKLLATADEGLRLEGLAALERSPGDVPLRPLCELLLDASEPVRVRAAEVLGKRGDESIFEALRQALEDERPPPLALAEALGRALAEIAPSQAARLFGAWIDPKSRFLRGLTPSQRALQWAAVAGTGLLAGPEADATLRGLAERPGAELRKHCLATLARRRKAAGHG